MDNNELFFNLCKLIVETVNQNSENKDLPWGKSFTWEWVAKVATKMMDNREKTE